MMRDGNQLPAVPAGFTTATSDPAVSPRRSLILAPLLAPLLAAAAVGLADQPALAAKLDPAETQITLPGAIKWTAWTSGPPHSGEMATLHGDLNAAAQYVVLMKWYPGLHERAAHLCDRSVVAGPVRHLVGEQRSRFRS